jgi:hypothetical protein
MKISQLIKNYKDVMIANLRYILFIIVALANLSYVSHVEAKEYFDDI